MIEVASLTVVMTVAGAFCVGVMAARRLRQGMERQRALAGDEADELRQLRPASHAPSGSAAVSRIREAVAEQLERHLREVAPHQGRAGVADRDASDLAIDGLRTGDVVSIEAAETSIAGDYVVDGVVRLQEGNLVAHVLVLSDGPETRWLVGTGDPSGLPSVSAWLMLAPVQDHGIVGEPPRNIQLSSSGGASTGFGLRRRGQASAARIGRHGRPAQGRVATYVYASMAEERLWVERWGDVVLVGRGLPLDPELVSFLPGS